MYECWSLSPCVCKETEQATDEMLSENHSCITSNTLQTGRKRERERDNDGEEPLGVRQDMNIHIVVRFGVSLFSAFTLFFLCAVGIVKVRCTYRELNTNETC